MKIPAAFLVNLGGLPRLTHKITMFCFMASNRRYYYFFFKFGLAVFLFGLLLQDITFNESGAVIAVHANANEVWVVRNLWRYTLDE